MPSHASTSTSCWDALAGERTVVYPSLDRDLDVKVAIVGAGIVGWNPHDRTWDCPCHGPASSRTGIVLSGPAATPLAPKEPQ